MRRERGPPPPAKQFQEEEEEEGGAQPQAKMAEMSLEEGEIRCVGLTQK